MGDHDRRLRGPIPNQKPYPDGGVMIFNGPHTYEVLSGDGLPTGSALVVDPASPSGFSFGAAATGAAPSTIDIQQRPDADKATPPTAANGVLTVQSIHDDGTIVVWERPDDATPFTVSATSVPGDGNPDLYPVVERANATRDVVPTAVEAPNPKDGDMVPVLLSDGTKQYFLYSGGAFQAPAQVTVEPSVPAEIDATGPFTGTAPSGVKFGLDVANQKIYGVDGSGNYAEIVTGVGSIEELDFVTANADLFVAPVDGDLTNPSTTLRVVKIDDVTDTVVYWERASAPGAFTISATTDDSIDTAYFDIQATDGGPLTTLPTAGETAANVIAGSIARKTFLPSRYVEVYRHTGTVWALDYVVPADLNTQSYPVNRTSATADNTPPTATEIPSPKLNDVALVKYPSGRLEAYKHDGTTWGVAPIWFVAGIPTATATLVARPDTQVTVPPTTGISTVVRVSSYHPNGTIVLWERADDTQPFTATSTNLSGDGNADVLPQIIEPTDNTRGILPTAAQTPTPKLDDTVEKRLPDGTVEIYKHDGTDWSLLDTIELSSTKPTYHSIINYTAPAPTIVPSANGEVYEIQLQPTYELTRTDATAGVKPTFGNIGDEIETTPVANSVTRVLFPDGSYEYWTWDGTDLQPGNAGDYPGPYVISAPALAGLSTDDWFEIHLNVGPDGSSAANADKRLDITGIPNLNGFLSTTADITTAYGSIKFKVNEAGDGYLIEHHENNGLTADNTVEAEKQRWYVATNTTVAKPCDKIVWAPGVTFKLAPAPVDGDEYEIAPGNSPPDWVTLLGTGGVQATAGTAIDTNSTATVGAGQTIDFTTADEISGTMLLRYDAAADNYVIHFSGVVTGSSQFDISEWFPSVDAQGEVVGSAAFIALAPNPVNHPLGSQLTMFNHAATGTNPTSTKYDRGVDNAGNPAWVGIL